MVLNSRLVFFPQSNLTSRSETDKPDISVNVDEIYQVQHTSAVSRCIVSIGVHHKHHADSRTCQESVVCPVWASIENNGLWHASEAVDMLPSKDAQNHGNSYTFIYIQSIYISMRRMHPADEDHVVELKAAASSATK